MKYTKMCRDVTHSQVQDSRLSVFETFLVSNLFTKDSANLIYFKMSIEIMLVLSTLLLMCIPNKEI